MQLLTPVNASEREQFLDLLRGFAILGIFIANLHGFSWYSPGIAPGSPYVSDWDSNMQFLHFLFIEGKFYSIFSLLFGWGIALQFKRAADKGINALPLVRRRLLFMLLLGGIHLVLWPGDIVFLYAMLGFILLPLRKLSNKTLVILGVLLTLSPILLYAAKMHWSWVNIPSDLLFEAGSSLDKKMLPVPVNSQEDIVNYLARANWWETLKANVPGALHRYSYLFFVSRIPKVLGIFLIGYALGRSGFYKKALQQKKILLFIIAGGLIIGLPANYLLARYMSENMADYFRLMPNGLRKTVAYSIGVLPLSLAYAGILALLFQQNTGKKLLSVFSPVGKMAFSNYVFQTFVGSFVFLGAGLGYIARVGPVYYTLFGIIIFLLQVVLSHLWLKKFYFGPIEWLWRSATYQKWQPFRRQ